MTSRLTRPLLLLAALLALGGAAPAQASFTMVGGGVLQITAGDGEANDLRIAPTATAGEVLVTEVAPLITQRRGTQCFSAGTNIARCTGVSSIVVDAGDGADSVALTSTLPATVTDGAGNDTITGGNGNDTFVGSPGDDTLIGGGGNDRFGDAGGNGADRLDGGTGTDTADYSARRSALHVTLDGAPGDGAAGEGDDVETTVEHVVGGAAADRLVGGDGNDHLKGNGGDDVLDGRGGADTLEGDDGSDTVDYRSRSVRVVASADGVAGDGAAGENDRILGDVDNLLGGTADDELVGHNDANTLDGGAGNDTLRALGGDDRVVGGTGDDLVEAGSGDDTVLAGDGRDDVDGGSDDDRLDGGAGPDALSGGTGSDVVDYATRTRAIEVDLRTGVTGESGEGDRIDGIQGAYGGGGDDRLLGEDNDGRFDGGAGDDVIDGRGGADWMAGGSGVDHVDYSARRRDVDVVLNDSRDDGENGERDDVRRDVERVTTGRGNDRFRGDETGEHFSGGAGDDTAWGNDGDDTLDGSSGADTLWPGRGDDVVRGGDDDDRIGGDAGTDALDGGPGNDRVDGGADADHLSGGAGNDRIDGGGGADQLSGGDGNDRLGGQDDADALDAGEGADQLQGGSGEDTLDGGGGDDDLGAGPGADLLAAGPGDDEADGEDGDDRVDGGPGADQVDGGRGDDALTGGDGDDRVHGGDGNDTQDGGAGRDRVLGGAGADALAGGPDGDTIGGDGGNDALDGSGGDDELHGGSDDDVLAGGPGRDVITGDGGEDTVDYAVRVEPLRITNDGKADDGASGEGDNVHGSVDHVIGGQGNDLIRTRTGGDHRLWGEGGNDTLDGGPKRDQLVGGAGNDQLIGREGKDTFDAGAGNDKLSGADGAAETLRCGPGKDSAVRDGADKAISCERLRRGSGTTSAPADGDVAELPESPGRRTGVRRVHGGGRFVGIPGFPGERIDRRLLKDIAYLRLKYKIAVTDGYAPTGHAHSGEHPRGLAIDIVPGAGGSWTDIDRLARWAEPRPGRPRAPFRWVGYNGDSGHGRGHHLHLSWKHSGTKRGKPARWVEVLSFRSNRPTVRVSNLTPLSARSNGRMGGAPSVRTGLGALPRCQGAAQLMRTWKAAGRAFKINWRILAAITEIESGFGCNMGPSTAGALGWTQFMPATWKIWGMDADGNGKASPYSSADAVFSSARYLRASGAPRNYRKALFAYNHAQWYVNDVLKRSRRYR